MVGFGSEIKDKPLRDSIRRESPNARPHLDSRVWMEGWDKVRDDIVVITWLHLADRRF